MPATTLDLTNQYAIEQNGFWVLTLRYPGDMRSARLRGQIRDHYKGDELASFRFAPPVYDEATNKTRCDMYLRAADTANIPTPDSGQHWVYDVLITLPSETDPRRLLQGAVAVSPGVTRA